MKYNYMVENTKLPRTRTGPGNQAMSIALPTLQDQTKTRISYLIATFNAFKSNISDRKFRQILAEMNRFKSEWIRRQDFFSQY
jgi:hypothetical protein